MREGRGVNCMVQLHIATASNLNSQAEEGAINNVTTIKGCDGTLRLNFSSFLFSSSIQIYRLKSGIYFVHFDTETIYGQYLNQHAMTMFLYQPKYQNHKYQQNQLVRYKIYWFGV